MILYMKILQYGYPRSGSTIVWYILDSIFSSENKESTNRWKLPDNVKKTHQINEITNKQYDNVVISIRDPFKVAISNLRLKTDLTKIKEKQYNIELLKIQSQYTKLLNLKESRFIFVDTTNKQPIDIIEQLEKKLNFNFEQYKTKYYLDKFSKNTIQNNIKNYNSFKEYNPVTLMHGNHINVKYDYDELYDLYFKDNNIYNNAYKIYKQLLEL